MFYYKLLRTTNYGLIKNQLFKHMKICLKIHILTTIPNDQFLVIFEAVTHSAYCTVECYYYEIYAFGLFTELYLIINPIYTRNHIW